MKKLLILAAALAAAGSAYAAEQESSRSLAADGLSKGFAAAALADTAQAVPQPGLPEQLEPPHGACQKPTVFIAGAGFIYSGGKLLGRGAVSFKTGCTGNVAWVDKSGYLYRNTDRMGLGAKEYNITVFGGDVIWLDAYKYMYRNGDRIGSEVKKYTISAVSGDVIWTDTYGYLYKNSGADTRRIGSNVREYKVSSFTGSVAWLDEFGYLYRTAGMNTVRLGQDVKEFAIAAVTGDVAWMDGSFLYKNNQRLTRDAREYRMDARGVVYWKDSAGVQHTA